MGHINRRCYLLFGTVTGSFYLLEFSVEDTNIGKIDYFVLEDCINLGNSTVVAIEDCSDERQLIDKGFLTICSSLSSGGIVLVEIAFPKDGHVGISLSGNIVCEIKNQQAGTFKKFLSVFSRSNQEIPDSDHKLLALYRCSSLILGLTKTGVFQIYNLHENHRRLIFETPIQQYQSLSTSILNPKAKIAVIKTGQKNTNQSISFIAVLSLFSGISTKKVDPSIILLHVTLNVNLAFDYDHIDEIPTTADLGREVTITSENELKLAGTLLDFDIGNNGILVSTLNASTNRSQMEFFELKRILDGTPVGHQVFSLDDLLSTRAKEDLLLGESGEAFINRVVAVNRHLPVSSLCRIFPSGRGGHKEYNSRYNIQETLSKELLKFGDGFDPRRYAEIIQKINGEAALFQQYSNVECILFSHANYTSQVPFVLRGTSLSMCLPTNQDQGIFQDMFKFIQVAPDRLLVSENDIAQRFKDLLVLDNGPSIEGFEQKYQDQKNAQIYTSLLKIKRNFTSAFSYIYSKRIAKQPISFEAILEGSEMAINLADHVELSHLEKNQKFINDLLTFCQSTCENFNHIFWTHGDRPSLGVADEVPIYNNLIEVISLAVGQTLNCYLDLLFSLLVLLKFIKKRNSFDRFDELFKSLFKQMKIGFFLTMFCNCITDLNQYKISDDILRNEFLSPLQIFLRNHSKSIFYGPRHQNV